VSGSRWRSFAGQSYNEYIARSEKLKLLENALRASGHAVEPQMIFSWD